MTTEGVAKAAQSHTAFRVAMILMMAVVFAVHVVTQAMVANSRARLCTTLGRSAGYTDAAVDLGATISPAIQEFRDGVLKRIQEKCE
jgi:hypothetical protein